jgi:hypothetical protein
MAGVSFDCGNPQAMCADTDVVLVLLRAAPQFLAFRLGEVKNDCHKLESALSHSRVSNCRAGAAHGGHMGTLAKPSAGGLSLTEQHIWAAWITMLALAEAAALHQDTHVLYDSVNLVVQAEANHHQQQYQDTQQQLQDLQEKHQRQTLELEAQLREQAVAAQQDKLQQVAAVREQLER